MSLFRVVTTKTGKERKYKLEYLRSKDQTNNRYDVYKILKWTPEEIELELDLLYEGVPIQEITKWQGYFGTAFIDVGFDDGYYAYSEYTWGHNHTMKLKIKQPTCNLTIEEIEADGRYVLA